MSGTTKKYVIQYTQGVFEEDLPRISTTARQRVQKAIEERLSLDPISYGRPLRYSLAGHRRLQVGDYRVVYRIEPKQNTVLVIAIKHRKEIYD